MKICRECGAQLPPGTIFCTVCGSKLDMNSQTDSPADVTGVTYDLTENNAPTEFAAAPPPPAPVKGKKNLALVIIIAAVALLAAAIGLVAWKIFPMLTGGKVDSTLVYVQVDDILKFVSPDMDSPEEVSSSFALPGESQWIGSMLTGRSEDGRYLGYLAGYSSTEWYNGYGDLYVRDLQSRSKQGNRDRGWKIASDVRPGFVFSDDGKYILYCNSDDELYASNFAESWKLDSDVYSIYQIEDGKVLYNKSLSDDYGLKTDFYIHSIDRNSSDKWKVGTEIYMLQDVSEGFAHIVYTKHGSEEATSEDDDGYMLNSSRRSFDVYRYTLADESSEALVKGIHILYSSDAESGDLVYSVFQGGALDYDHLIDDDLADADALVREPEISDYPLLNELSELQDDSYYGVSDEVGAFLEENYDALEAEYEQAAEDYEKYFENVEGKRTRDALREDLKHEIESGLFVVTGDIYLFRGGEKIKLDSDVVLDSGGYVGITADLEENFALYVKSDLSKISKIKLSEYAGNPTDNLSNTVAKQLTSELYLTYLDGSPQRVAGVGSGKQLSRYFVSSQGDGLYYLESRQVGDTLAGGDLYYVPISKGQLGEAEKVDDNVGILDDLDNHQGAYLYGKDLKDDTFDLYTVNKGGSQLVSYDASYLAGAGFIAADSPYIYYTEEYNTERSIGDLYFYLNEKQLIDSDVHSFYYKADNAIYLLRDYRNGKGDLYFYDGKKTTVVDYDVVSVLN